MKHVSLLLTVKETQVSNYGAVPYTFQLVLLEPVVLERTFSVSDFSELNDI